MSRNKEYMHDYYERVTKPKRQKLAKAEKERKKKLLKEIKSEPMQVQRVCSVCGKKWVELVDFIPTRLYKMCPKCKAEREQYSYRTLTREQKDRINERNRKRYAESEDVRKRQREHSKKWLAKVKEDGIRYELLRRKQREYSKRYMTKKRKEQKEQKDKEG